MCRAFSLAVRVNPVCARAPWRACVRAWGLLPSCRALVTGSLTLVCLFAFGFRTLRQAVVDLMTSNGYRHLGNVSGPKRAKKIRRNDWFVREGFVPSAKPNVAPGDYV